MVRRDASRGLKKQIVFFQFMQTLSPCEVGQFSYAKSYQISCQRSSVETENGASFWGGKKKVGQHPSSWGIQVKGRGGGGGGGGEEGRGVGEKRRNLATPTRRGLQLSLTYLAEELLSSQSSLPL